MFLDNKQLSQCEIKYYKSNSENVKTETSNKIVYGLTDFQSRLYHR